METWDQMLARHKRERELFGQRAAMLSINAQVAASRGLRVGQMHSRSRAHHISHARFEAMARMRAADFSLSEIERFYGLDRTSVKHGIRRHKELSK